MHEMFIETYNNDMADGSGKDWYSITTLAVYLKRLAPKHLSIEKEKPLPEQRNF